MERVSDAELPIDTYWHDKADRWWQAFNAGYFHAQRTHVDAKELKRRIEAQFKKMSEYDRGALSYALDYIDEMLREKGE